MFAAWLTGMQPACASTGSLSPTAFASYGRQNSGMRSKSSVFDAATEIKDQVVAAVGGPTHFQVIVVLVAVLGLVDADLATVSAVADELKGAFRLTNTQIGLLLSTVVYATAAATLPLGLLADRISRTRLLIITSATWALAMIASGFAFSFGYLLGLRINLLLAPDRAPHTAPVQCRPRQHRRYRGGNEARPAKLDGKVRLTHVAQAVVADAGGEQEDVHHPKGIDVHDPTKRWAQPAWAMPELQSRQDGREQAKAQEGKYDDQNGTQARQ